MFAKHFGTPTPEEKRAFTRVLQGHIAIDVAVFPNGTTGYILYVLPVQIERACKRQCLNLLTFASDPFARRPLWEDGLGE